MLTWVQQNNPFRKVMGINSRWNRVLAVNRARFGFYENQKLLTMLLSAILQSEFSANPYKLFLKVHLQISVNCFFNCRV